MLRQGGGSLINTTSVNGLVAEPYLAIYATSKGAIVMLSKGIALDYAKQGIRCNALAPGWVDTPINYAHAEMLGGLKEVYATIDSFQPIGRPGDAARARQRGPVPRVGRVVVRHRLRDRRRRRDDGQVAAQRRRPTGQPPLPQPEHTRTTPMPKQQARPHAHEPHQKHPRLEELEGMVRNGEIDTLVVAITDMQGRLVGKRVQAQAFLNGVIDHGAHFCTYLLGTDMEMNTPDGFALMNWETGYGDWIAQPVWDSLRVLPWLERTALVLADATDEETGEEIPVSPRTILKRQVERAAAMGLAVKAGSELEYYVLKDSWESLAERGWPLPKPFGYYNEDYHLLQATKAEPLHRLLRNQMTEARIPIEFSKGEAAAGQHEVNIRYDHVLESADRTVIFKHGAKEIAYLNGWGITFMAKPDHRWTGSSGHLHMSIWGIDDDKPLMHAAPGEPAGPYGLSDARQPVRRRDDGAVTRARAVHRAVRQQLQALRGAVLGAGQRGLGPRQPDDRVPARR